MPGRWGGHSPSGEPELRHGWGAAISQGARTQPGLASPLHSRLRSSLVDIASGQRVESGPGEGPVPSRSQILLPAGAGANPANPQLHSGHQSPEGTESTGRAAAGLRGQGQGPSHTPSALTTRPVVRQARRNSRTSQHSGKQVRPHHTGCLEGQKGRRTEGQKDRRTERQKDRRTGQKDRKKAAVPDILCQMESTRMSDDE